MKYFINTYLFKRNILFLSLFILFTFSCCDPSDGGGSASTEATITIDDVNILVDESILFKNSTVGADEKVVWNFGDGSTSNVSNPTHTYTNLGNYVVSLKVLNKTTNAILSSTTKTVVVSLSDVISNRNTLKEKFNSLGTKIMVCAHRATEDGYPENSLSAIQNAINLDIEMVELDIRETKDGKLVLMHDATLDRTTTGTGNVSDYTLSQIKQFNLEKSNGTITIEKIPTLEEVFELTRGKIYVNLDINEKAPFLKTYPVVKQYGMTKQVMFYTKTNSLILSMLSTNADLVVLPYIDNEAELNSFNNSNLSIVHYSETSFNTTLVGKAAAKSIMVYANVYVNTSTTPTSDGNFLIDNFISLKGNVIQTDYPEHIKTYLQGKNLN